ncbi:NAD(P)-binding protein [Bradyrhizobium septentrionale]|nr:NAD(P)-binding protein [Bradyrhizobium septentrionale]UGY14880.1 NAD(P)-binding protein [Bradyrhizobium septentrionale]UGY23453.1 NAD(P)-binding protein [Bradyrhizobium septentrionale]
MTRRPRKALIIGAGIAGPVTAMFLTRAGIEAELYEAWPYSTGSAADCRLRPTACTCWRSSASPTN